MWQIWFNFEYNEIETFASNRFKPFTVYITELPDYAYKSELKVCVQ